MYSIFVILCLFIALPIVRGIDTIYMLKVGPKYYMKVVRINACGLIFVKNDDIWEKKFSKPTFMVDYSCIYENPLDKGNDEREKQLYKRMNLLKTIIGIVPLAISVGLLLVNNGLKESILFQLLLAICTDIFFWEIFLVLIMVLAVKNKNSGMNGYIQSVIKQLLTCSSFEMIEFKKLNELPYTNISDFNRVRYYSLAMFYYVGIEDMTMISVIAHDIARMIRDRNYRVTNPSCALWVVYYYSRYEVNYELATLYYNKLKNHILSDPDTNARRVLAYYNYAITRNIPLARQYLNEGFAGLEKFSMGLERELERKLLWELDGFMKNNGC